MKSKNQGALMDICPEISMHGFSHLNSQVSNKAHYFWMCIISGACIGTGLHLYSLINLYLQYDYYETVRMEHGRLEFPDLTLCNSEVISLYNAQKHPNVTNYLLRKTLKAWVFSNTERSILPYTNIAFLSNIENGLIPKISTALNELIVDCKYQNINCFKPGQFHLYIHHSFGSCFTFRFGDNVPEIRPGIEEGLSLILKGNQHANFAYDMMSKTANVNGIKVAIHEKGTLPPVLRNAIDIAPGTSTNIGLILRKFNRLNAPYDSCHDGDENPGQSEFIYSQNLCEQQVKSKIIKDKCNCTSTDYYHTGKNGKLTENCYYSDYGEDGVTMKELLDKMNCQSALNFSEWAENLGKCTWPCKQNDYEASISQTYWPQDSMIPDFILNFILSLPCESPVRFYYEHIPKSASYNATIANNRRYNACNYPEPEEESVDFKYLAKIFSNPDLASPGLLDNISYKIDTSVIAQNENEWIKTYFYRLNIYFSSPTIEMHRQVISFSMADLLSSVGGVTGLWSGCSIITFFEIVWVVGRLVNGWPTNNKTHVKP